MKTEFIKSTPIFTHENLPEKLKRKHFLPEDMHGELIVLEGRLSFCTEDEKIQLKKGDVHIIEALKMHHVELAEDASFRIDLYKIL